MGKCLSKSSSATHTSQSQPVVAATNRKRVDNTNAAAAATTISTIPTPASLPPRIESNHRKDARSPDHSSHDNPEDDVSNTNNNTTRGGKYAPNDVVSKAKPRFIPSGYSSGASTPASVGSFDESDVLSDSRRDGKEMERSASLLALNKMDKGDLTNNIVRLELLPFGKPIEEVYDGVHDGPILGSGLNGSVRLIKHRLTGATYAVKCLDLSEVESEDNIRQLREEIAIMCQLDHPNIVRLEEVYESMNEIYLVQELCEGGELFDRLDEQPDYHYNEAACARLIKQMLSAVRYIHSKGIIHRDLKLENFLFSSTHSDSKLKLIDFGLSKHFKIGEVQREAVGTPYTVAPEVIRGAYDERCDIWAIGVITYLLLSGDAPFGGCGGPENLAQVRANILNARFRFQPADVWGEVSEDAKDFIRKLLVTDPTKRPTAKECQKSTWLKKMSAASMNIDSSKLSPNVVKALVGFKEYSKMRKLLCEVLSFTLLPDQITHLHKEFERFDTDGSGEISLSGLKRVLMSNAGAGSLGALSEKEVEDIFNAMRVRGTETRIHWHEFIAAMLSQCKVDERNLRLAFDRLDSEHKGFITFQNLMDIMGRDAESEEALQAVWGDCVGVGNNDEVRITYAEFLLLMKGGSIKSNAVENFSSAKRSSTLSVDSDFSPILEEDDEDDDLEQEDTTRSRRDTDAKLDDRFERLSLSPDFLTIRRTRSADAADETDTTLSHDEMILNRETSEISTDSITKSRQGLAAQRKMRRAVRDAIKRFEDEQMKRAMAELRAEEEAKKTVHVGAGLVMRHGLPVEVTQESVRKVMMQRQEQQELLLQKANQRGGRRGPRTKTKSDMTALMAYIPPSDEDTLSHKHRLDNPDSLLEVHESSRRNPTKPGHFRKTADPFEAHGYIKE